MSTVAWPKVRSIVAAALDLAPEERGEFLDRACGKRGSSDRFRSEVEAMLDAALRAEGALPLDPDRTNALSLTFGVSGGVVGGHGRLPAIRERFGAYEVRRLLGRGSMGAVFEAFDTRLRRVVALKLMPSRFATPGMRARFEGESRVLARLQHPNIAQVYESGVHLEDPVPSEGDVATGGVLGPLHETAIATPYFAMELVEGARTLGDYVAEARPSREALLELMAQVADAVHHGHQKQVIHRDIKPANILVGRDGRARLIDFGVARMEQDVAEPEGRGGAITMAGQIVGTLNYMSPEACAGSSTEGGTNDPTLDVDVRTDIYSLGAVLYEVLTGRVPLDLGSVSTLRAIQLIRDQAPARPSSIDRSLAGDLETIIQKAIAKDRSGRYASASDLAGDIRRYLAHQPILARRPTMGRTARLFVRRHRVGVGVAAAVALALAVGVTGLAVGRARAKHAQALALAEAARSRRVSNFLKELLASAGPVAPGLGVDNKDGEASGVASQSWWQPTSAWGAPPVAVEALASLDRSTTLVDVLAHVGPRLAQVFEDDPALGAELDMLFGFAQYSRGLDPMAHFERAHAAALRLFGPHDARTGEAAYWLALSWTWKDWAKASSLAGDAYAALAASRGPASIEALQAAQLEATAMRELGEHASARALLDQMQRAIESEFGPHTIRAHYGRAVRGLVLCDDPSEEAGAREALEALRTEPSLHPFESAAACLAVARCVVSRAVPELISDAAPLYGHAASLYDSARMPMLAYQARAEQVAALAREGRMDEAIAAARALLAGIAPYAHVDSHFVARPKGTISRLLVEAEQSPAEARGLAREAAASMRRAGFEEHDWWVLFFNASEAGAMRQMGDAAGALDFLQGRLSLADSNGVSVESWVGCWVYTQLALCRIDLASTAQDRAQLDLARADLRRASACFDQMKDPHYPLGRPLRRAEATLTNADHR